MQYSPLVSELNPKDEIEGAFLLKFLSLQTDKKGKAYLNLVLMDRSGEVEARLWDNALSAFDSIQTRDIVRVLGKVNLFQGKKQLVLQAIQKAPANLYPADRFIPASVFPLETMYSHILSIIHSLKDPFALKLSLAVFCDEEIKKKILRAPAAKSMHHAYAGGLLEHILSISRIMVFLGNHYEAYYGNALNKDLLILGAIFHDIGKIEELEWERTTEYTTYGKLIGHVVGGCELVDRYIQKIPDFPVELQMLIKHQILAHHGHLEYGSPKLPATVEALLVHAIDDLDSKVNSIFSIIEKDQSVGEWTVYNKSYERIFLKPKTAPKMQGQSPGIPN